MISHKHQCIFIHIPKCAGTSIEKALGHFDESLSRGRQDHRSIRMIEKPFVPSKAFANSENIKDTIRRFREYWRENVNPNNKLSVSRQQYESYFKFSIVRNPWDRAYSWYKNVMRDPIHQANYCVPANISFDDFIRKFAGTGYLRPQTYWLENYNNKLDFDFIGKFENLTNDFNYICKELQIRPQSLPHEVKSWDTSESVVFISSSTKQFIDSFYAKEIEIFAYDFHRDCSLNTK